MLTDQLALAEFNVITENKHRRKLYLLAKRNTLVAMCASPVSYFIAGVKAGWNFLCDICMTSEKQKSYILSVRENSHVSFVGFF